MEPFPVNEGVRMLCAATPPLTRVERLPLSSLAGRTLAEPVIAPIDVPPFSKAAMDGFGIRGVDSPGVFNVVGSLGAGDVWNGRVGPKEAVRILTGAPIPAGVDTVVEQERVEVLSGQTVRIGSGFARGRNIAPRGGEMSRGRILLEPGTRIHPYHIGLLAGVGLDAAAVFRRPRILLAVTGSEMAPAGTPLSGGRIYDTNGPLLEALAIAAGAELTRAPVIPDRLADHAAFWQQDFGHYDLILTTGGVSVGDRDYVVQTLKDYARLLFWRLDMHPGKSVAAAKIADKTVVALSGNPGAAVASWLLVVLPLLAHMHHARLVQSPVAGMLTVPFPKPTRETRYLRARFVEETGVIRFDWNLSQDSDRLTSYLEADGLVMIPRGSKPVGTEELLTGMRMPSMGGRDVHWAP